MTDKVTINDQTYHAIRVVANSFTYSPDYITRLARERKVKAVQLRRRWYVHLGSLQAYADVQEAEQAVRKKQLQEERRIERQRKQLRPIAPVHVPYRFEVQVVATALGFLFVGGLIGMQLSEAVPIQTQVASVGDQQSDNQSQSTASNELLQPVFTESTRHITVENGRTIPRPASENRWTYIHHE